MRLTVSKRQVTDKLYFLLMFVAIYCSHDTLLFGTNSNDTFVTLRQLIVFGLIGCLLLLNRIQAITLRQLMFTLVFIALPFLSAFFNGEALDNYIYRASIMICAVLFVLAGKEKEFCLNFNSIMYFLSAWSISTFLLANLLPSVTAIFPTIINVAGTPSNFMLFSCSAFSKSYGLVRNTGIFREPGVFAAFLAIALIIELVATDKPRTRYMVIFTVAMLSTLSTAGYIILAFIYIYMLLSSKNFKHKYAISALLFVGVLAISGATGFFSATGALWNKFVEGSNSYGSWFSRLSSLTENWKIALNNPLFGIGRYTLYDTVLAVNGVYRVADNTNTMMINFSAYGLAFGFISLYGLWRFFKNHRRGLVSALLGMGIVFTALSNEDMGQNVVYYFIILSGLLYDPVQTQLNEYNTL